MYIKIGNIRIFEREIIKIVGFLIYEYVFKVFKVDLNVCLWRVLVFYDKVVGINSFENLILKLENRV